MNELITREQFGLHLFDTIKTIGGIIGIDQQRARAIHKHEDVKTQALLDQRRELQRALADQLPLLTNDEMDRVLAKYPWIVTV